MMISVHSMAIGTFVPSLETLAALIDKGAEHAASAGHKEPLALGRLAPDMFTFATQVQLACYQALDLVARLTGKESPKLEPPDTDTSVDALKARIAKTIEQLKAVSAADLDAAVDRPISLPLANNTLLYEAKGHEFLRDWGLPHFYFHVVTAYDILRHKGVPLGKPDFMQHLKGYIRPNK